MLRLLTFIALALLLAIAPGRADERILLFDSAIDVKADGTLIVTETIRVTAEGRQIRRGIYRDFPLMVENAEGREVEVPFKILGVTKNGQSEPYHTEKVSRAIRIYVGSRDVFLNQPGLRLQDFHLDTFRSTPKVGSAILASRRQLTSVRRPTDSIEMIVSFCT